NTTVINTVINNPNPTPAQLHAAGVTAAMGGAPVTAAPQLPAAAMQRANLVQPGGPQGATPAQGAMGAPGAAPNAATPRNAMGAPGAHTLPGAKKGPPLPQSATAPANATQQHGAAQPGVMQPGAAQPGS
ncbi:caspase-like domain-containing protein, partial [Pandoraea nosoerga]|nr:caspase-like domain-containing protein [Pandoraea nosoerga]